VVPPSSLYGLKQAPRAWHTKLKMELENMSFQASETDPGLYIQRRKDINVYILVYVDDILIVAKDLELVRDIKKTLMTTFDARDLGEAAYFLGWEIKRDRVKKTIKVTQQRMTTDLVNKYGMKNVSTHIKREHTNQHNIDQICVYMRVCVYVCVCVCVCV